MRRFPDLGVGLGLRAPHFSRILRDRPEIPWFEATTENYMGIRGGSAGRPLKILEQIRHDHAVVLHGVSLNIGSTDPLDRDYLRGVRTLIERIEPSWISDHVCWTGVGGENLHDLLPLPYTRESLDHLVPRILEVQDFLGRPMVFENVSAYLSFAHSEMTEWEFLSELARRSDCGLLIDVNNIYVSSRNQGFDPLDFLDGIPAAHVGQMHLAGHSRQGDFLIDTHDHPVPDEVWSIFREAVARFPAVSAMIEWDAQIPEFEVLEAEAHKARRLIEEVSASLVPKSRSMKKASSTRVAMRSLAELQYWMRWAITDPRGIGSALADPASGTRIEPTPNCLDAITDSPPSSRVDRLGIYAEAYYARIHEALENDFPTLRRSIGENPFRKLVSDFLVHHPSDSPNLGDLGSRLPTFLRSHEFHGLCDYLVEIAEVEWAIVQAFYASPSEPFDPKTLAGVPGEAWACARMKLDSSVQLLTFGFPVDELWHSRDAENFETIEGSLQPESIHVVVHRAFEQTQIERLGGSAFEVLRRFLARESLGEVLASLPEELPSSEVMEWFGKWVQIGIIRKVEFAL